MNGKIVVSTPLDADTAHLLDVFCEKGHLTRAEALRGLVDALLVDGKQFIFKEWRSSGATPAAHRSKLPNKIHECNRIAPFGM